MPNTARYKNLNLPLVTNPFKAQRPPSPHSNSTYLSSHLQTWLSCSFPGFLEVAFPVNLAKVERCRASMREELPTVKRWIQRTHIYTSSAIITSIMALTLLLTPIYIMRFNFCQQPMMPLRCEGKRLSDNTKPKSMRHLKHPVFLAEAWFTTSV